MKRKLIIYFVALSFLNISLTFSQDSKGKLKEIAKKKNVSFVKVKVVIYKKDTLAKILRRFVKEDSVINRKTAMVDRTLKSNPHIKDWRNLKAGETLDLYLDPKFIDLGKMKKFRQDVKKVSKNIKTKIKNQKKKSKPKTKSIFYMASLGQFSQENADIAKVEFKQNSPVTLGGMYTYYPENDKYSISTSAYFSYLLAASSNLEGGEVEVPLEIGLNAYYQYPLGNGSYNVYGGLDFEKFNTFNLASVDDENDLIFDENQLGFATIGFSKSFKLASRGFLFKGSFSQSVFSSRTVGYSGDSDSTAYSGSKIMGFLLSKLNDKFYLSSLLKYHVLSGPSDVTALRIGVGCGYFF